MAGTARGASWKMYRVGERVRAEQCPDSDRVPGDSEGAQVLCIYYIIPPLRTLDR